jgi:glycosyltransferase involved in cell wall biosynthesis
MRVLVFSLAMGFSGEGGTSGGDRILINTIKKLESRANFAVYASELGAMQLRHYGVGKNLINVVRFRGGLLGSLASGVRLGLRLAVDGREIIVYSNSNFLPDLLPALMLKLRLGKNARLVVGYWMIAPRPLARDWPYRGRTFLRGLLYYINDVFAQWLAVRLADALFLTNPLDAQYFAEVRGFPRDRMLVVRGGVDSSQCVERSSVEYDAVFVGRLHPQKGVLQLVDIWKRVVEVKRDAKLAIIGNGALEQDLRRKIDDMKLERNIDMLGFMDGPAKMEVIARSRIVVHPVIYDSGGMAAAESMVCGLPCVAFDIPSIRAYYPKGCLRTRPYDLDEFAKAILRLLVDDELYAKLSREGKQYYRSWDWSLRIEDIFRFLSTLNVRDRDVAQDIGDHTGVR